MTSDATTTLEQLKDPGNTVSDVTGLVRTLTKEGSFERSLSIGLSSNITTDMLELYLQKYGFLNGHATQVLKGGYDDHLNNVKNFSVQGADEVVLMNFFDNLVPSLESRISSLEPEFLQDLQDKLAFETRLVLEEAASIRQVYVTLFHRFSPMVSLGGDEVISAVIGEFNKVLEEQCTGFANVSLISLDAIASEVGRSNIYNPRYYFRFKAPYTVLFFDELARRISLANRGGASYLYKAIVLDCDNTLWGGIIGEDLIGNIKIDPDAYPGKVYWTVQNEMLMLREMGLLLCLCSKNNPKDVDEVLENHEHQVLRDQHIITKKVNWNTKVENIQEIAAELNIGLDSLIFVDDSPFEIESVQSQLPQVKTFLVPKNIFKYPDLIYRIKELCLSGRRDQAGGEKTVQYRIRAQGEAQRKQFATQADYLESLQIQVEVKRNDLKTIPRVSELSQKSNQFNLTTRRYTETDITNFMNDPDTDVFTLTARDRFGESGLTGIVILKYEDSTVIVDSVILSCRVIGRGIEYSFWNRLLELAVERECERINAEFIATVKNDQVREFYDKVGLTPVQANEDRRVYENEITKTKIQQQNHVKVTYVF